MKLSFPLLTRTAYILALHTAIACSYTPEADMDYQPLNVQAELAVVSVTSRAADSGTSPYYPEAVFNKKAFTDNEEISITDGGNTYTYKKSGEKWIPVTQGSYFTLNSTGNYTFTATYTNSSDGGDGSIPQDQTKLDDFRKCFYHQLKSPSTSPVANTNTLNFTGNSALHPVTARITVKVSYPEVRMPVSVTLTGNGIRTGATGTSETIQCLYMNEPTQIDNFTKTQVQYWTALIKPGNDLQYTITIKCKVTDSINSTEIEKTGTYTQTAKTLSAGTNYIYNFSFSDYPKLESVQVDDFTSSSGDIDAGSAQ